MLGRIQQQNQELNESSARVRAVLNSAMSAVIVMDAKGIIIDWNMRAEKIFGLTRYEVLGKELAEVIIPPEYRERHRQGLQRFLATGEGPLIDQLTEISAIRKDGSEFPAELSVSVLKTGNTISFCGFITDITERRQAEEEIQSFNQSLEQKVADRTEELQIANKELEAFSYSVSHDLRAPLRSIHGYMNIFSEDYYSKLDDEGKRLIDIILRNSKTMGRLIDDLLAFSQLGRRELMKGPVSMKEIAAGVWEDQKRMEGNREVTFNLKALPDAYADSGTIKQVWANLISNALKYSSNKEKTIIEIGGEAKKDESLYFIRDNGAGFDMKYYNKLFGVFQRLHSAGEFEGTGVGLAIVQRIISKHGGKVWAEAKPDEGATFYFTLPKNLD
jgi:PAS domain S-box-containing protein